MAPRKDLLERYGAALREARMKADLTQQEAAERAGIARSKWCYYEAGKKNVSLLTAEKLAIAAKSTLESLIRKASHL